MTDPNPGFPNHAAKPVVERKVTVATVSTYLGGLVILCLVNAFTGNDNQLLLASLPDAVEPFILPMVPALLSFIGGWTAQHTPRPDLGR